MENQETSILFDAIEFATLAHRGQFRKGTRVPYIVHPLNVAKLLIESDAAANTVIAGVLHDTIEDAGVTSDQIAQRFGKEVCELVAAVTEPPRSLVWEDRKRTVLKRLESAPLAVLELECADKLDNIRAIQEDYARYGDALWERFNRPRPYQQWYYASMAQLLVRRIPAWETNLLLRRFIHAVQDVFGTTAPPPNLF